MFAFVVAEVVTANGAHHAVTLWDTIIQSPAAAHIRLSGARTDYEWIDDWRTIRDSNITLAMYYDTMPYVGPLHLGAANSGSVRMPAKHCHRAAQCSVTKDASVSKGAVHAADLPLPVRHIDAPSSSAMPLQLRKWY